jgi:hypothetical protein
MQYLKKIITQQMFNEINKYRLLTKVCSNYTIKLHFCGIK